MSFTDEPLEWVCWPGIIVGRYFNTKIKEMPAVSIYARKANKVLHIGYATFTIKKLWWINQNRSVPHFCLYIHKKTT